MVFVRDHPALTEDKMVGSISACAAELKIRCPDLIKLSLCRLCASV